MITPREPMRDALAEASLQRRRILLGFLLIVVALLVLAARFAWLQIVSYEEYHTRSEANRIRARPIVPARGLIFDRKGRLLADNRPAWRLDVVREDAGDLATLIERLRPIIEVSDDDVAAFMASARAQRGFQAVPLKLRLGEAELARFAVQRHRFPGVEAVPYLNRHYPYGELFAHVLGYVGRIDGADLARVEAQRYRGATHIGKVGIERQYESRLHGEVGIERVEVNAEGRTLRIIERELAVAGQDLYLSVDAELQQAVVDAFDGQHGAAVVLDPRNGEVLSLVSLPAYDPNPFVSGISHQAYARLLQAPSRPLFNRALQGGYEPGSTLKPFLALAGLEYGLRRPEDTVVSTGVFRLPGQEREYRDWLRDGHGRVDLKQAVAQSVNTYFYQLAVDLGIDRLSAYMARFGFGQPTGIDLPGEAVGILPSAEWKRAARGQGWFTGETVITGIGQGFWVTTPLQLAQATATLAAGGVHHTPHLVRASQQGFGAPMQLEPLAGPAPSILEGASHAGVIRDAMVAVMHGETGTARRTVEGFDLDYAIAGKTGTAQRVTRRGDASLVVSDLPLEQRHNALFIAFAPAAAPRVALMVIVEHGGSGSAAAAPVGVRIIDAWLRRNPS